MTAKAGSYDLSLVVMAHNMARELPRTLTSLSHKYQRDRGDLTYDVLVVDNGSTEPVSASMVAAIDPLFKVRRIDDAPPSPVYGCNLGVAQTTGRYVGVILDGARLVTPRAISQGVRAAATHPRAIVTALAWHLGPAHQSLSIANGYDPDVEDAMLESISWPSDGYRLFDICALAGANPGGFLGPVTESCFLVLPRELWEEVGGLDPAFDSPGGGLVALDLFARLLALPRTQLIVLLGEGSFHQVHGGVTTKPGTDLKPWFLQYERIRGTPYVAPVVNPTYFGELGGPARRWLTGPPETPQQSVMRRLRTRAGRSLRRSRARRS